MKRILIDVRSEK